MRAAVATKQHLSEVVTVIAAEMIDTATAALAPAAADLFVAVLAVSFMDNILQCDSEGVFQYL
jgi:hypothetical protein